MGELLRAKCRSLLKFSTLLKTSELTAPRSIFRMRKFLLNVSLFMLATYSFINFAWRDKGHSFPASDTKRKKGARGSLRCEAINRPASSRGKILHNRVRSKSGLRKLMAELLSDSDRRG